MQAARSIVLLVFGTTALPCFAADSFKKELERNLKNQILILRTPVSGEKIEFGENASADLAETGSLQFDSVVQLRKIKVNKTNLTLEAVRLWPFYDEKQKRIAFNRTDLKLRIRLAGTSEELLKANLARVFLDVNEMEHFLKSLQTSFADPNVFKVGADVSPPKPTYNPEPDYSHAARQAKKTGVVLLQVVVGPDGRVRNIQVKRPVGSGLDEKAVEAVKTWRFQPALKDGKPVAVLVNIEVGFNLH
jgi:TonB family protein